MLILSHKLSLASISTLRADANVNAAFNLAKSLSHWQCIEKMSDAENSFGSILSLMLNLISKVGSTAKVTACADTSLNAALNSLESFSIVQSYQKNREAEKSEVSKVQMMNRSRHTGKEIDWV